MFVTGEAPRTGASFPVYTLSVARPRHIPHTDALPTDTVRAQFAHEAHELVGMTGDACGHEDHRARCTAPFAHARLATGFFTPFFTPL